LTFNFYNFKYVPPKHIEYTLYWTNFVIPSLFFEPVQPKRGIMQRRLKTPKKIQLCVFEKIIQENIELIVHFYILDAKKIEICMVYLRVKEFENTLNFA